VAKLRATMFVDHTALISSVPTPPWPGSELRAVWAGLAPAQRSVAARRLCVLAAHVVPEVVTQDGQLAAPPGTHRTLDEWGGVAPEGGWADGMLVPQPGTVAFQVRERKILQGEGTVPVDLTGAQEWMRILYEEGQQVGQDTHFAARILGCAGGKLGVAHRLPLT
jgi:hypothetical protein